MKNLSILIFLSAFLIFSGCAKKKATDQTLVDPKNLKGETIESSQYEASAESTTNAAEHVAENTAESVIDSENVNDDENAQLKDDLSNYREVSYSFGSSVNILNMEKEPLAPDNMIAGDDNINTILDLILFLDGYQGETTAITYSFAYVNDVPAAIRLGDEREYTYLARSCFTVNEELLTELDICPQVLNEGDNTLVLYMFGYYPASGDYFYTVIEKKFSSAINKNEAQDNPYIIAEEELDSKPVYTEIEQGKTNVYFNSGSMIYPEKYLGESRLFHVVEEPYHITINNHEETEDRCIVFVLKEGELLNLFDGYAGVAYTSDELIVQRIFDRTAEELRVNKGYNLYGIFIMNIDRMMEESFPTYIEK